jgi:hypothetical protein
MTRRSLVALLTAALVAAGFTSLVNFTRGPAPITPEPAGTWSFAALGDTPYTFFEDIQYKVLLQDLAQHDLGVIVHIGDLFWTPCVDERYEQSLREFNSLPHPLVYTPGDNEWSDCWDHGTNPLLPLDRLASVRRIFFSTPTRSLGDGSLALESQAHGASDFREYVENQRWTLNGVVFATVHMVGSTNGRVDFPGRTAADSVESVRRTEAASAWVREAFAEAGRLGASAVVIAFHASVYIDAPALDENRRAYDPFLETLEDESARWAKPVLLIHGDEHIYHVDHPLTRRATGEVLANVTRLEIPGSFDVGWVKVTVHPGAAQLWSFEKRVVPHWKYW